MSSQLYRNRHDLYRTPGPGAAVPCPKIGAKERMRAELERIKVPEEEMGRYLDRLGPHDSSCHTCHGRDIIYPSETKGYWCKGCGLQSDSLEHPDIFDLTCCLSVGAGTYEELRYQHEDGHHDWMNPAKGIPACPGCAARRLELATRTP